MQLSKYMSITTVAILCSSTISTNVLGSDNSDEISTVSNMTPRLTLQEDETLARKANVTFILENLGRELNTIQQQLTAMRSKTAKREQQERALSNGLATLY